MKTLVSTLSFLAVLTIAAVTNSNAQLVPGIVWNFNNPFTVNTPTYVNTGQFSSASLSLSGLSFDNSFNSFPTLPLLNGIPVPNPSPPGGAISGGTVSTATISATLSSPLASNLLAIGYDSRGFSGGGTIFVDVVAVDSFLGTVSVTNAFSSSMLTAFTRNTFSLDSIPALAAATSITSLVFTLSSDSDKIFDTLVIYIPEPTAITVVVGLLLLAFLILKRKISGRVKSSTVT